MFLSHFIPVICCGSSSRKVIYLKYKSLSAQCHHGTGKKPKSLQRLACSSHFTKLHSCPSIMLTTLPSQTLAVPQAGVQISLWLAPLHLLVQFKVLPKTLLSSLKPPLAILFKTAECTVALFFLTSTHDPLLGFIVNPPISFVVF